MWRSSRDQIPDPPRPIGDGLMLGLGILATLASATMVVVELVHGSWLEAGIALAFAITGAKIILDEMS
jgi:hypothetical protein